MIPTPHTGGDPRATMQLQYVQKMVRAGNNVFDRAREFGKPDLWPYDNSSCTIVLVENQSGEAAKIHQPLWVDASALTPSKAGEYPVVSGMPLESSNASDYPNYCVTLEPIPTDGIGHAMITGNLVCKISMRSDWSWCKRVGFDPALSTEKLSVMANGNGSILWYDSTADDNEPLAWVNLGLPQYITMQAKTPSGSGITAGSSGTVNVWEGGSNRTNCTVTAHLDWMHSSTNISANKELLIQWQPYEDKWRVIGAECE